MGKLNAVRNLKMLMTEAELDRVELREKDCEGGIEVTVDLHGMRKREANRYLNNLIKLIRDPFSLKVIHGYRHGTVLKKMVNHDLENKRIEHRFISPKNMGVTELSIRGLAI